MEIEYTPSKSSSRSVSSLGVHGAISTSFTVPKNVSVSASEPAK